MFRTRTLIIISFVLLRTEFFGQNITCPSPIIYFFAGTVITGYNTSLPVSSTNPFSTGIPSPPGNGLALMPNINGGTLSPTFYSSGGSFYYYWNGASWVNTNVTVNGAGVNVGGCGSAIYSLANTSVYVSSTGSPSTSLLTTFTVSATSMIPDIVADCNCNFYIFSTIGPKLTKYDPAGNVLATYTITGIPGIAGGGGFAIVGNKVYCPAGVNTIYVGTITTGSTIAFTAVPGSINSGTDWASCPVDINAVPVIGTISVNASSCQTATVIAASNSAVTYSWSGPGITVPVTSSAIVTNTTGIYTCTVFSNGCGIPPTLSLTAAMSINTCVTVASTSITCANLGSATVSIPGSNAYTYTWMPGAQTGSVATGLSPGTYTLTVFDPGNSTSYTTTTSFTSLIPLTGNVSNSSSVTCYGAATGSAGVTNISGGSGTQNYSWSDGINTYTVNNPANLNAGAWTLLLTDALTGCTVNQNFLITQPPATTLVLSADSPSICVGGSVVLTATASGGTPGYTYTWTSGQTGTTQTVSQNQAGTSIYTLNVADYYNCLTSETIAVNFVPNPTVTVSNVSICPLQTGILTAFGATTYAWDNSSTGNTLSDSPAATQQYVVTGSALGCTASASASIILKPVPIPVINQNGTVCQGKIFTLGGAGGTSYSWTGPAGYASSSQNNTISPVQLNQAGVYYLTVTAANACTAGISSTLVVNPLPVIAIAPNSPSICANTNSVILTANGTATLYNWNPTTGLSATTTQTVNAFPAATTVYTLTGSLNSCTAIATATVNVVPPPSLNITLSNGSLCAQAFNGSANTITLTSSGAATYTISTPNHFSNTNPSGPASNLSMQPPYQPVGPATATVYGSNGACTVSATRVFTIIPNPTVSIISPTPVICAGQSYTYTSSGASSYTWSAASPGNTIYTTGDVTVANPTINSVFSVYGGSLGCNSPLQSSTITVNPLPQVFISPNPTFVCLGTPVQLTANGPVGTTYSWSPSLWLSAGTGNTVNANPPILQIYTILASLNTCTSLATATVSVKPLPTPGITVSKQSLCANDSVVLFGSGGVAYSWIGPGQFSLGAQNIRIKIFSSASSGIYTLTVSDENHCLGSVTQSITVFDLPQGYLSSAHMQGCVPLCSDLTFHANSLTAPITSVSWQVNNHTYTGNTFRDCFNSPGDYLLQGTVSDSHSCVNTLTAAINVYPQPTADFSFSPAQPIENFEEVQFTNTSQGGVKFNWIFGNNHNNSAQQDPTFLYEDAGTYPVVLVTSNQWNCADTVIKLITVASDFAVYVPSAFTPNDDGRNELYRPVLRGISKFTFSVYDRWGEKLFETTDVNSGWDGNYRGEACKEDTYVWRLVVTSFSTIKKEERILTGQVLLYR